MSSYCSFGWKFYNTFKRQWFAKDRESLHELEVYRTDVDLESQKQHGGELMEAIQLLLTSPPVVFCQKNEWHQRYIVIISVCWQKYLTKYVYLSAMERKVSKEDSSSSFCKPLITPLSSTPMA